MKETLQSTDGPVQTEDSYPPAEKCSQEADIVSRENRESDRAVGIRSALQDIFAWPNYKIYLVTAWAFSGGTVIWSYFGLYLRYLKWDYVLIGVVLSAAATVSAVCRFLGGYIGDNTNRKTLAVVAMFMAAAYHIVVGLFTDTVMIIIGLLIISTMDLVKSGSSAYLLENIPDRHSGLALSLFSAGKSFGIATLLVLGALIPLVGFTQGIRDMYLGVGVLLLLCTLVRALWLEGSPPDMRERKKTLVMDFAAENINTMRELTRTMPTVLVIIVLDSMSDSIFKFGALIYSNEFVGIDILGINMILLGTLVVSVPLLLKTGRFSDTRGTRKAGMLVYGMMPIAAVLLVVAPAVPVWAPVGAVERADAVYPGLGVIFTTPFLAIMIKYVNDALWGLIIITLIKRMLPRNNTAKALAMMTMIGYACAAVGPLVGGFVFKYLPPSMLFVLVLWLNVIILGVLANTHMEEGGSVGRQVG